MGRRPVPDADPLRRAARLQGRPAGDRRRQLHVRGQGRRRLFGVQVRGRHPSGPTGPRDRVPGPDPHLDRDRRGAAGGRGRRHRRSTPTTSRSTSTAAPDPAASRSTPPTRRSGSRTSRRRRRLHAGREVAAAEPRAGDEGAAGAAVRAGAGRAAGRAGANRLAQVGTGDRAEKIRTYNYGERRVNDHRINLRVHNLDEILFGANSTSSPTRSRTMRSAVRLEDAAERVRDGLGTRMTTRPVTSGRGRTRPRSRSVRRCATRPRVCRRRRTRPGSTPSPPLAEVLGSGRERLILDRDLPLEPADADPLRRLAGSSVRAVSRSPTSSVAVSSGYRTLGVDERVLIPRPEMELLGRGRARARWGASVLDVGSRQRRGRPGAQIRAS